MDIFLYMQVCGDVHVPKKLDLREGEKDKTSKTFIQVEKFESTGDWF